MPNVIQERVRGRLFSPDRTLLEPRVQKHSPTVLVSVYLDGASITIKCVFILDVSGYRQRLYWCSILNTAAYSLHVFYTAMRIRKRQQEPGHS